MRHHLRSAAWCQGHQPLLHAVARATSLTFVPSELSVYSVVPRMSMKGVQGRDRYVERLQEA
jgi:hypothetical protein